VLYYENFKAVLAGVALLTAHVPPHNKYLKDFPAQLMFVLHQLDPIGTVRAIHLQSYLIFLIYFISQKLFPDINKELLNIQIKVQSEMHTLVQSRSKLAKLEQKSLLMDKKRMEALAKHVPDVVLASLSSSHQRKLKQLFKVRSSIECKESLLLPTAYLLIVIFMQGASHPTGHLTASKILIFLKDCDMLSRTVTQGKIDLITRKHSKDPKKPNHYSIETFLNCLADVSRLINSQVPVKEVYFQYFLVCKYFSLFVILFTGSGGASG
jgi:hypothetical protein